MVFRFNVSAPGKVILHGEHSVVYGKPAIAGVVQVRNKLQLQEQPQGTNISVHFTKLGLHFALSNEALNTFASSLRPKYESVAHLPQDLDHGAFSEEINAFVREQFQSKPPLSDRERNSIVSFVYLLVGIKLAKRDYGQLPFDVHLETAMSIGAGLGSSASFGVCLAGAFVVLAGLHGDADFLQKFNHNQEMDRNAILQEISDWAFCSEKIMHGNPSGLDNTICTFGDVVKFYRGQKPEGISLRCPIPILLVDSNVSRSTATLVQKVVALKEKHPQLVQSIFDAMGHVVEDAVEILKTVKEGEEADKFKELETLVAINNNLLRAIDVSHPQLERIFAAADRHGFKAKLSGAGGGGFAMILLGPQEQWAARGYEALKRDLLDHKFELIETTVGGDGLQVEEWSL